MVISKCIECQQYREVFHECTECGPVCAKHHEQHLGNPEADCNKSMYEVDPVYQAIRKAGRR